MSLLPWLRGSIGVRSVVGNEAWTACPVCGHDRFYFNMKKKIGFCHHDRCHWTPTLDDLIRHIGYPPDQSGLYLRPETKEEETVICLPEGAQPLVYYEDMTYYTDNLEAYKYLEKRNVGAADMIRFRIHWLDDRIYVPIREDNELVSYVSRQYTPGSKGYLYPKGGKQARTFLGWDEVKNWSWITLVENTFVSMWLRSPLNCTTNFGSHLSRYQMDKIALHSQIKEVVLLWDEGAEHSAWRAIEKLRARGLCANICKVTGQPDDHPLEELQQRVANSRKEMKSWVEKLRQASTTQ